MLNITKQNFQNGDIRFLTVRGHKPEEQTVSFVHNMCKKISNTYLIIREPNVQNEKSHFHAILKIHHVPHRGWFKKGLHIKLKKVYLKPVSAPFNQKDSLDTLPFPEVHSDIVDILEDQCINRLINHAVNRMTDVERVLTYMSKQIALPFRQYENYIYVVGNRQQTIPTQGVNEE